MSAQAPFAICGIDHVVLRAHDLPRLVAFYVDVLGCPIERVAGELTQLRAGKALVDIVPRASGEGDGRNVDHLCLTILPFNAEDLSRWFAAHDVAVGAVETRYGADGYGASIYLTDPEGNGIEIKATM